MMSSPTFPSRFFRLPFICKTGGMTLLMTINTLCVAQTHPAPEQEIPSLFYSAAERARIEQQRKGLDMNEAEGVSPNTLRQIQFNGWVDRKENRSTIWINQRPWLEGTQDIPGYPSHLDHKASGLRIDGRTLRVGETLDLESKQQTDLLPSGALTVRSFPFQKK